MIEQRMRNAFDAVGDYEPALPFDADRLITKAHKETTRRRALVGAGVGVVAIAAGAVMVTGSGTPAGGGSIDVGSSSPTPPGLRPIGGGDGPRREPIKDWPPAGVRPKHYTAEQLRAISERTRAYFGTRLGTIVPGATQVSATSFGTNRVPYGQVIDGQRHLIGFVDLTVDGRRYEHGLQVLLNGPGDPAQGLDCGMDRSTCTRIARPDGSFVTVEREGGMMFVTHYRNDGVQVRVCGYVKQHGTPPLTEGQAIAVATDPMLTM
ncbi:hypothetical protein EV193_103718 [Herbihabitans rhizosphaerae]|uniref:Uncharacterized protein n=1 Tax=Herbihabitans rhizosphaerae TaxID=1872711 RepID=A0A4Q7KXD6_9PSEU|nr:hypothetical protein [Herbihabitans rhizosphaerae]RZS41395.1 hypothetical protein EV193_103718 [Herbihabitans rhizosphaerae]